MALGPSVPTVQEFELHLSRTSADSRGSIPSYSERRGQRWVTWQRGCFHVPMGGPGGCLLGNGFAEGPLDPLPSMRPHLEGEGSIRHQTVTADPLPTLPLHGEVSSNKEEDGTPRGVSHRLSRVCCTGVQWPHWCLTPRGGL